MNPFEELCGDVQASGIGALIVQPPRKDGDAYYLAELYVFNTFREHGHGSNIMNKVVAICDREGVDMELEASDDLGSDLSRLYDFYGRFGFKHTGKREIMRRIHGGS